MMKIRDEMHLSLAVTLSVIRDKLTAPDHNKEVPDKFKDLRLKHKNDLDSLNEKFNGVLKRCQADNVDFETDDEYQDVKNKLNRALDLLNIDCLGELSESSKVFLEEIAAAHSHFIESLVNLATVFEIESHVNFEAIKEMFILWHENTVASIHCYMKHADILAKFPDEESRNQQLIRHRTAALLDADCQFNEVVDSVGYDVLPAAFRKHNEANVKAIDRARDFLTSFSIMTFKNPFTWQLVKFRDTGEIPPRFLYLSDGGVYSEQAKQLVSAKLKSDITKISGDSFLLKLSLN
jgi:hypothetical protein